MKAEELRIGNMVRVIKTGGYNNIGDIIKVVSIDSYGINKWRDMGASGCNTFDGIDGIPLTEEWLLKFGFLNGNKELSNCDLWNKHWIVDFEIEKDGEEYIYGSGTEFKYVHQLQNLYFALSGKELKIF